MWIREFREREGLELYQLQQRVNYYSRISPEPLQGMVSAELLHRLEIEDCCVTHPRIANVIAAVCGATAKQRDMIVSLEHRGEWKPTEATRMLARKANRITDNSNVSRNELNDMLPVNRQAVYKIDICGNIIEYFESTTAASLAEGISTNAIKNRCRRVVVQEFGKYKGMDGSYVQRKYTFRYKNEWDNMTREQRIADVEKSKRNGESKRDDRETETGVEIES